MSFFAIRRAAVWRCARANAAEPNRARHETHCSSIARDPDNPGCRLPSEPHSASPAPPQDYCGSDAAHFFEESAGCEIDMLLCDTDEDDLLCDSVAARDELVPPTARRGVVTVHSLFEVDRFAPFA